MEDQIPLEYCFSRILWKNEIHNFCGIWTSSTQKWNYFPLYVYTVNELTEITFSTNSVEIKFSTEFMGNNIPVESSLPLIDAL